MAKEELFMERRRFRRIEKKLPAAFKIVSDAADNGSLYRLPQKQEALSANISEGGAQLLIDGTRLDLAQIVGLELKLEETGRNIKTFAEVKWTSYDESSRRFKTGFEFIAIKDDDKDTIKQISKP